VPLPTITEIELAGIKAWPAVDTATDGTWVLRASGGYTNRANSVQCNDLGDDTDAPARLERAVRWYRDRSLPPIWRVTPLAGPRIMAELDRGWRAYGHSHVLAMDLGPLSFEPDGNSTLVAVDSKEWLDIQKELQGYDDATLLRLKLIVERFKAPAKGIVFYGEDASPSAAAYMVVVNGMVYSGNVITDASQRGKGHARRMMLSGFAWARKTGARRAAIQVAADNPAGIALYKSLGFIHQYDYHYRTLAP
jgi:GNAT superfamily N-acetyltransferase